MLNNCHLSQLIHEQAKAYGRRTALMWRDYARDSWQPVSWDTFSAMVRRASVALLRMNVGVQENIAVFSQNKPESLYVDYGAYGIRAVTIPFYATSSGAQVTYMMNDAEVRYLFVGEQEQYDTILDVAALCHHLERIVIFDRRVKRRPHDHISVYFDEWLPAADALTPDELLAVEQRMAAATFDDVANILYTSGTTGDSKGVILTYGMYHEGIRVNDAVLTLSERDVILNFLPFTHVFERAWSYLCLAEGARLAINLRPADVLRSLREVHPTCMSSVPRFWEKVYQGVLEKLENSSYVERRLIRGAIETGERCWTDYLSKGLPLPKWLGAKYALYNRTVIKALRRTLGLENANFFPTAGAAVSPDVERFVHAAGINMIVGYGLTESTATVSCDHGGVVNTLGSVGRLIDGLEIKLGENNEILLRGKTITPGYYKKESATKQAIDADGWFHTGDAGYLKDGELFLTERIKDLFKTSNGKYIAPQCIESKLVIDKYFEQAVIVADRRKFVAALIVPSFPLLRKYAESQGITVDSNEALCADPTINSMLAQRIDMLLQGLAHYERVKRFLLLPTPFSVANGELTNTLKVRRRVVYEHYAAAIDRLYAEAESDYSASTQNTTTNE